MRSRSRSLSKERSTQGVREERNEKPKIDGKSKDEGKEPDAHMAPSATPESSAFVPAPLTELEREAQREAEQAQLEEEMRKRRERYLHLHSFNTILLSFLTPFTYVYRVKAWQEAKAKAAAIEEVDSARSEEVVTTNGVEVQSRKGFSLDDDEEDDAEVVKGDEITKGKVDELLLNLPISSLEQQADEAFGVLAASPLRAGKKTPFVLGNNNATQPTSALKTAASSASAMEVVESFPAPSWGASSSTVSNQDEVDPLDAFMSALEGATDQVGFGQSNSVDDVTAGEYVLCYSSPSSSI